MGRVGGLVLKESPLLQTQDAVPAVHDVKRRVDKGRYSSRLLGQEGMEFLLVFLEMKTFHQAQEGVPFNVVSLRGFHTQIIAMKRWRLRIPSVEIEVVDASKYFLKDNVFPAVDSAVEDEHGPEFLPPLKSRSQPLHNVGALVLLLGFLLGAFCSFLVCDAREDGADVVEDGLHQIHVRRWHREIVAQTRGNLAW